MRAETDIQAVAAPTLVLPRVSARSLVAATAPFLAALTAYLAVLAVMHPGTTGDEPHYLLISQSIVRDGDVDLLNDYASRERVLNVYGAYPIESHADAFGSSPALRPVHGIGLPVLLAPSLALGGQVLARLFMVLLAALLADQLFRLLRDLGGRRLWRVLAWAAVVFCLPVVVFSNQFYPEVPAALIVLAILRIVIRPHPPGVALAGGSLGAAFLPWLHVRFLTVAFAATLALAWAAYRKAGRPGWAALVCVPPALSVAGLGLAFERWYASPLPSAPYSGGFAGGDVGSAGAGFLYHYFLADLFHAGGGWIPYSPVAWLGLAGLGLVVWRWRLAGAAALGAVALYASLVASNGLPGGYQFPGRILLVAIVLVAVPLALVLEHVPPARFVFAPLLALSLAVAVAGVRDHDSLYAVNGTRDDARLPLVRDYRGAFPDPRTRVPTGPIVVQPGALAPLTGRAEDGVATASEALGDQAGVLLWGPHASVAAGSWIAKVDLAASGTPRPWRVARIDVRGDGHLLVRRPVAAREIAAPGRTEIVVPFELPKRMPLDVWVTFRGHGMLETGPLTLLPETATGRKPQRFPDWPLASLWVGLTVAAGTAFVLVARRRR